MLKRILFLLFLGFLPGLLVAQKWNLRTIVDHAMANNINVKLSEVQERVAAINSKQSRLSVYPNLSFGGNAGLNFGNNQDPTNFTRTTQTNFSNGLQLQSSVDIFNFYSKKNSIAANEWELKAAGAATEKIRNDIALTAANAYLQILLSLSQENITVVQIQQTQAQLTNTRKMVNAGALPELNATQLEAQLALDSVNYLTAKGNTSLAILTLKSYMNIDPAVPFEVDTPPVESIPLEPIGSLQPDYVYQLAIKNMPQQRYNEFKMKAAERGVASSRGAMYPSLTGFGNLGTSYITFFNAPNYESQFTGNYIPGAQTITVGVGGQPVIVGGQPYVVNNPEFKIVQKGYVRTDPYFDQLSNNFKQAVGISINVPIFNGAALRSNYERSKLNVNSIVLQKERDDQQLKQDIYQAYNSAVIAYEKFNASKKSVDINELTFNYANKRFGVGMLGTFDLITTQNNLLRSRLEYTLNRFDYVFKMKVLEFYKGLGLKL